MSCTYLLTGLACVSRVYTELAVLNITPQGVAVREMAEGLEFAALQSRTGFQLLPAVRACAQRKTPAEAGVFLMALKSADFKRQAHSDLSSAGASVVGSGRSTSSTKAIGALSPTRKPIFRIRV